MQLDLNAATLSLQPGQILRIHNGQARHLSLVQGSLWVTQESDPRDTVLSAGDDFRFDRPGTALAMALGGTAQFAYEEGITFDTLEVKPAWNPLRALFALARKWLVRQRAGRDRDALRTLSDRELRDIGLHRSQLV